MAAVRAGDDRAFELLFGRYQSRIAAYVRGMVRDHGRAEDITQEVFISALRRLRQTEAPIAFKPWIYEIAKNACIDAFRHARNANEVSFDAEGGPGSSIVDRGGAPDALVDTKLAIDNLCSAFGGLSQTHHDILVMREFEGLTYRDIGERLGLSGAAVESALFRARRRLGEEYEELVSGERCLRVRGIVDSHTGRAAGLREQRRMARHLAHCQPCRRYARLAGADLDALRPSTAARLAALLPLPAFLRRRLDLGEAGPVLAPGSPALHWSTKAAAVLDPATVSTWPKAIATAATVAVAGLGAGAAVGERDTLQDFVHRTPAIGALVPAPASRTRDAAPDRAPQPRNERSSGASTSAPATPGGASAPGVTPAASGDTNSAPADRGEEPGVGTSPPDAPASRPAAMPGANPPKAADLPKGVDAPLPDASPAKAGAALGDVAGEPPARSDPAGNLLDGVGRTLPGSAGSSTPSSVGDAISTGGATATQGPLPAGAGATGVPTAETAATATGGATRITTGTSLPADPTAPLNGAITGPR